MQAILIFAVLIALFAAVAGFATDSRDGDDWIVHRQA